MQKLVVIFPTSETGRSTLIQSKEVNHIIVVFLTKIDKKIRKSLLDYRSLYFIRPNALGKNTFIASYLQKLYGKIYKERN